MPITELVVVEGGIAVAYLLAIGALALGVIAVTPRRLRIARNCFWASCAIFAGIAIMWGITTDYSFWPRIVIAGALGAIAAVAAVEATRFITHEQKESQPESRSEGQRISAKSHRSICAKTFYGMRSCKSSNSLAKRSIVCLTIKPNSRTVWRWVSRIRR